jgi:hypothetical protein
VSVFVCLFAKPTIAPYMTSPYMTSACYKTDELGGLECAHKLAGKLAGEHVLANLPPLIEYPRPLSFAEVVAKALSKGELEVQAGVYGHGVAGDAVGGVGARLAALWLSESGVLEVMEAWGDVVRVCGWVRRVREDGRALSSAAASYYYEGP